MGKIITTLIDRFDGGLTEDKRSGWTGSSGFFTTNKYSITKHFDALTYPKKLVPHYASEVSPGIATADVKDMKLVKFVYGPNQNATTFRLYGLGVKAGTTYAKLHKIDLASPTGWTACTGEGASARNENVLFYYNDYVYNYAGTGNNILQRLHITDEAFTETYQTLGTTSSPIQPVLHPSDGYAYFFSDTVVYRLADTAWTTAFTIPASAGLRIVAACPFNNFLALGCVSSGDANIRTTVLLWDRDTTLNTITERIDMGEGSLLHLASLNNKLIGVLNFYLNSSFGLSRGKILVKQASGVMAVTLNEIVTDTAFTLGLPGTEVVRNNRLYFPMKATLNGDTRLGIWAVDDTGRMALSYVEPTATSYEGIFVAGNVWWISHSGDYSVSKTAEPVAWDVIANAPSYESLVFNAGDSSMSKKLISATVMFEPLVNPSTVQLEYRINNETDWTTIFSRSTAGTGVTLISVGAIKHTAINIESSGVNLPSFNEIQFRIKSVKAAITGLKFKVETEDKDIA